MAFSDLEFEFSWALSFVQKYYEVYIPISMVFRVLVRCSFNGRLIFLIERTLLFDGLYILDDFFTHHDFFRTECFVHHDSVFDSQLRVARPNY